MSGSTVYTCMLNKHGGVEADLTVSRLEPGVANLPLAPQSDGQQHFYLHHSGQFSFHVDSASDVTGSSQYCRSPLEGDTVLGILHIVTKAAMFSLVFRVFFFLFTMTMVVMFLCF